MKKTTLIKSSFLEVRFNPRELISLQCAYSLLDISSITVVVVKFSMHADEHNKELTHFTVDVTARTVFTYKIIIWYTGEYFDRDFH